MEGIQAIQWNDNHRTYAIDGSFEFQVKIPFSETGSMVYWGKYNELPTHVQEHLKAEASKEFDQQQLQSAIEILKKNLIQDKDYYEGWKANIAMSFYTEFYKPNNFTFGYISPKYMIDITNKAADNVLQLLIQ
jgi:hypothetical protein